MTTRNSTEPTRCEVRRRTRRPLQHREVTVRLGDMQAQVDEGIAPVIRETWRAGVKTEEACQGRYEEMYGRTLAYVAFPVADAERWMRIVCPDAPWMGRVDYSTYPPTVEGESSEPLSADEKRWLARHRARIGYEGPKRDRWEFALLPYDGWGMSVRFSMLIYLPPKDLSDVLSILRAHNAAAERVTR